MYLVNTSDNFDIAESTSKVKFYPSTYLDSVWGIGVIAPLILHFGTRWGKRLQWTLEPVWMLWSRAVSLVPSKHWTLNSHIQPIA